MAVTLATVTGTFPAGAAAYPEFTPSQAVNIDGAPELLGAQPVKAQITGGALKAADGTSPLQLPVTSQGTPVGATGFWYWQVTGLPGVPAFGFFLTGDADLSALVNSPASGGGAVASVFGRTGAVVAAGGDYTAAQVGADASGAAAAAQAAAQAYTDAETARATAAESGKVARAGDAMTGKLAPKVVTLADAATIAVDASLGNDFRVTLAGNRTMGVPSSAADGQPVTFELVQDATGSRTVTWASGAGGYTFGAGTAPVLSTAAGAHDLVGFRYSAGKGMWLALGSALGF